MISIDMCTVNLFKEYLFEEEKSMNTIEKYTRDCLVLIKWLDGRKVTKAVLVEYKAWLCTVHAPSSVNSMISSVNTLFAFLGRCDLKIKTLKIQRKVFCESEKVLTKAEYERLLKRAQEKNDLRLYFLMQTIACTGIRISELEYVTLEALKKGVATIHCKGKIRQVLLPSGLCRALLSYAKKEKIKNGCVFVSKNGKPLDRSNIWKMLKKICHGTGVLKSKVFPHNFRHLFARTFYSVQKDIVHLADILGHSNINTTRIYTAESKESHAKQLQQLGLLIC